jgi:probable HAF family extracellular repeat protein
MNPTDDAPRGTGPRTPVLVAAAVVMVAAAATCAAPPRYDLELIPLFDGDFANTATAINGTGQVAGWSNAPGGNHAWRWADGELDDLGSMGGPVMRSTAINEAGHVAGYGNDSDLDWVGWVWDGTGVDTIPTLGGDGSRAWGLNDDGLAVGDAQIPGGVWNAIRWDGATLVNLGTLGGANSQAYDVDNTGRIAGFATNTAIEARAVIWHEGRTIEMEQPAGHSDSVAYGVNEAGVVIGTVGNGVDVVIPALWIDGAVQLLPPLPVGDQKSWAWKLNASLQAVGWSQPGFADTRATTWIDGEVFELNELVDTEIEIELTQAWDVNDDGVIVGFGLMESGPRAFVLRPRPVGDLDGDGVVGFPDLLIVLGAWGPCPPPPDHCPADIDRDGEVGFADLLIVLGKWGAT